MKFYLVLLLLLITYVFLVVYAMLITKNPKVINLIVVVGGVFLLGTLMIRRDESYMTLVQVLTLFLEMLNSTRANFPILLLLLQVQHLAMLRLLSILMEMMTLHMSVLVLILSKRIHQMMMVCMLMWHWILILM